MSKNQPKVIVKKGRIRWYYNMVAINGQVTSTSQKYFSKGNAIRAARRLALETGAKLEVR